MQDLFDLIVIMTAVAVTLDILHRLFDRTTTRRYDAPQRVKKA